MLCNAEMYHHPAAAYNNTGAHAGKRRDSSTGVLGLYERAESYCYHRRLRTGLEACRRELLCQRSSLGSHLRKCPA